MAYKKVMLRTIPYKSACNREQSILQKPQNEFFNKAPVARPHKKRRQRPIVRKDVCMKCSYVQVAGGTDKRRHQ